MDIYSGKRSVGQNSAHKKKSNSRDEEVIQFCNRIGCSGRLNHANHTQKVNQNKLKSKARYGQPESNPVLTLKPNSSSTAVEVGSSSNTRVRRVYGQKPRPANQDGQSGLVDRGRRNDVVKRRSTEGETSSRSSVRGGGGGSSVRTRRPVSARVNNQSSMQSTRVITDNVDSIASVLLALERIDQDEGLSFESNLQQILGSSFLGGFNFYDQYRGMRLDIDNMSYEELLALEDEIGVVSTALSEEELSKCLKIGVYKPLHINECKLRGNWCLNDTKCSICQEEFISGDEIGSMRCDHGYHAACINQWLQLKNWCPVCKASAHM